MVIYSDWEEYNVEVSALDMRGSMATKFAKTKKDPVYQLECWVILFIQY
jgi:hypothetical protein